MSTVVVVDAGLAVKWFLPEDLAAEATALLGIWQRQGIDRVVPGWFACEVANVLYTRLRSGALDLLQAQAGLTSILKWTAMRDIEPAVSVRALEIAVTLARPATYDSHYLALAEQLGCELWTADKRLWNAANPAYPWVRWIGELAPASSQTGQAGP